MHQGTIKILFAKTLPSPRRRYLSAALILPETDCLLLTIIIFILLQNYCLEVPTVTV